MENSSLVDDLIEIKEFNFGYTISKSDELDLSKQLEKIRKEKKDTQIANRKYSVAKKRLDRYIFGVNKSLGNGFQELPDSNKENILEKLGPKLKDIASSTGLYREKINELTEDYSGKLRILYYHSYLEDSK